MSPTRNKSPDFSNGDKNNDIEEYIKTFTMAETENPYINAVNKKIRAAKKKYLKLLTIEEKGAKNDQQERLLAEKDGLEKKLADFFSLKTQFEGFDRKVNQAEKRKENQKKKAAKVEKIEENPEEPVASEKNNTVEEITQLLHAINFFSKSKPGGEDARSNYLSIEDEKNKLIQSGANFDALNYFLSLVTGQAAAESDVAGFPQRIAEAKNHIEQYLKESDDIVFNNVTYKFVKSQVNEIITSNFFNPVEVEKEPISQEPEIPEEIRQEEPKEEKVEKSKTPKNEKKIEKSGEESVNSSEEQVRNNDSYRGRGRGRGRGSFRGNNRGSIRGSDRGRGGRGRGSYRGNRGGKSTPNPNLSTE